MSTITPDFIQHILRNGGLAQAQDRAQAGLARPRKQLRGDKFSVWALICEEILDTEHDPEWYDDILLELSDRGLSYDQINRMRVFAWQTAGWLNYDKALWEWCCLNEGDIRLALDYQLKEKIITPSQYAVQIAYIDTPSLTPPLT